MWRESSFCMRKWNCMCETVDQPNTQYIVKCSLSSFPPTLDYQCGPPCHLIIKHQQAAHCRTLVPNKFNVQTRRGRNSRETGWNTKEVRRVVCACFIQKGTVCAMRWGVEMKERKEEKKTSLKFPVFLPCPESILPAWPRAGEGQTMKWGRTRGSPLRFRRLFLPTLFCFPTLWKYIPSPLFLPCLFPLCIFLLLHCKMLQRPHPPHKKHLPTPFSLQSPSFSFSRSLHCQH